jgi:hypothetical protein
MIYIVDLKEFKWEINKFNAHKILTFLIFQMVDIYMPVVESGYVPFFADVLSIYSCILLFFSLEGEMPNSHTTIL